MRKVKMILTFEMLRENEVRSLRLNFLYFLTEVEGNLQATDEEAINIYKETLREKLQNFNKNKRIWRFEKVISLDIHFTVYDPLRGSSYIELPKSFQRKKAIVNIKNEDDDCFKWCITRALGNLPWVWIIHKTDWHLEAEEWGEPCQ